MSPRRRLIRQINRKFGIAAPRLAVRPHVPWYLRWAVVLPFVLLAAALIWQAYDSGLEFAGFRRGQAERDLAKLNEQVSALTAENARLSSQAALFEKQAQVERAANQETSRQLKNMTEENARLQEDLALFQSLSMGGGQAAGLSMHRLKVERDTLPGEYRYRLLLVQNDTRRAREFQGRLQLLVNTRQNGKKTVVIFPPENAPEDAAYRINFKYYQRIERSFQLPPDSSVEGIQVRIFERGASEPAIKQDAALS